MTPPGDKPTGNRAHIEERARYWFSLMRSDACADEDKIEHKIWLNTNLAHRRAYRELEELWGLLGDFAAGAEVKEACRKAERYSSKHNVVYQLAPANRCSQQEAAPDLETMEVEEREMVAEPTHRKKPHRFTPKWLSMAMAASLIAVMLGTGLLYSNTLMTAWQTDTYQTAQGEKKAVELEDGSYLLMDAETRVSIHFTQEKRFITLERGRAHFDVAHNKNRPFMVTAGLGVVTALGTAFVVNKQEDNEVLVALIEGKVSVKQENTTASTLLPGQQITYSNKGISEKKQVDVAKVTAWKHIRLEFENSSLSQLLKDLNRYSQTKILLGNGVLQDKKISGVFKTGNNKKVVQTLAAYFDVKAINDDQGNFVLIPQD